MASRTHFTCVLVLGILGIVVAVGELIVTGDPWVGIHQNTTVTCSVVMAQALDLNWRKGPLGAPNSASQPILLYDTTRPTNLVTWSETVDRTHFTFDETKADFPLSILSVTLEDEGRYWCQVTDDVTFSVSYKQTEIRIRVPPTTMTVTYGGSSYGNGDSISLVAGDDHQFTCNVPGVKPAANFTWTLGGATLEQTGLQEDTVNQGDSRLVDSAVTEQAVNIAESPGTQMLSCGATNRQDGLTDAEVAVTVTVQVKVPPSASSMTLLNSNDVALTPDAAVPVDQSVEYTFMCAVRGTRPSVLITWLLQERMQSSGGSGTPVRDELFDTLSEWSFIPRRDDHGSAVKCSAETAETMSPAPFVSVTLQVNGPPDAPTIAGVTLMTENDPVDLTCTAGNGYPDDWVLAWLIDDTPLDTNTTTTPSSLGTRFSFSSALTFTPGRRDNGQSIVCRAVRGVDTSADGTSGPLNVQYEVFFINTDDLTVGAKEGATALLRCTAMGNPLPQTEWISDTGEIITNQTEPGKLNVAHTTSGDDMEGYSVASTLEITRVVATSDYGVYTCQSRNSIGMAVSLDIELNDQVKPQPPTSVTIDRGQITATSVQVVWTPGNDGGETQWFYVNRRQVTTSVGFDPATRSKRIDDVTEYLLERLSPFSLYEIAVYAGNANGLSKPVKRNATTLPSNPENLGIDVTLSRATGTISLENIPQNDDGCLQLEFRLNEQSDWYNYGGCQGTNTELMLEELRSRFCQDGLCSEPSQADVDASRGDVGLIVGIVLLIVILLVVVLAFLVFIFHRRRVYRMRKQALVSKQKKKPEMEYQELDIPMQIVSGPPAAKRIEPEPAYDDVPEIDIITAVPRDRVEITKPLGEGAFGRVLLGKARSIVRRGVVTDVAIKTLKDGAGPTQKDDLLRELDLMKSLPTHNNVVKLLGFCIEKDPIYIIVELLPKGNLKDLLTESRGKGKAKLQVYGNLHGTSKNLTSRDLIAMGRDVADGMAFLSDQECIHRDLAARNILVNKDMVCKVADFGLARDVKDERVYHRKSDTPLPIRWMAPESIFDDVYTTKTDIWSFGVLLWEIVTLGARPYPSMSVKAVTTEIRNGYRMPRPEHCQDDLYQMMLKCWSDDPEDRPSFQKLDTKLGMLLETASDYISLTDYQESLYEVTMPSTSDEKV